MSAAEDLDDVDDAAALRAQLDRIEAKLDRLLARRRAEPVAPTGRTRDPAITTRAVKAMTRARTAAGGGEG